MTGVKFIEYAKDTCPKPDGIFEHLVMPVSWCQNRAVLMKLVYVFSRGFVFVFELLMSYVFTWTLVQCRVRLFKNKLTLFLVPATGS